MASSSLSLSSSSSMERLNPWSKSLSSQTTLESPATMPVHFFSESPRSFGDSFTRRASITREPKGKERERIEFPYDQDPSISSHDSSLRTPKPTPKPTSPRKPRTSLLFSLVRKRSSHTNSVSSHDRPLILPGIIEITRPYSYVQEEQERERLRDAAAQSIGLADYPASEHPADTQEDLVPDTPRVPTIDSPSPVPPSPIPSPTPTPLPPFPASLASLSPRITLSGSFPKFCPPSSLLVYALAKQWKTRCIVLTTATDGRVAHTVTHLHLFKSNFLSSSELHRLPITQDTAIYVTEQGATMNSRNTTLGKRDSRTGTRGKSSGSVVAIEQGEIIWHFEMQDPNERQKWIGAIKAVVLGQRSMRAGLTASPHPLNGHEPRGDMDVMLSMRLQASLSSAASPVSPTITSPRTSSPSPSPASPPISPPISPIRTSLSLEGLRSQTPTSTNTELFTRGSSIKSSTKSQSYNNARRSGSSSGPGSGSSSPTQSIRLQSKRSGNLSVAMINAVSQTHSTKSSTSTTKTIKGMFGTRSRSPSLSHEREGEYAEESFGTVGSSLMGIGSGVGASINRTGSPMYRAESPVPSVASSGRDESSVHVPYETIHNGNLSNGVSSSNGSTSINGIPACDLKIVKEDERCSPCPSTHALPSSPSHTPLLSHPHSHSASHSLHPPPRGRKQTLVHPLADAMCQQMDTAPSIQTSVEDSPVTPRAMTPTLIPDPARLSVYTTSTTTSASVERSGSSSSTPSRRWSRTLPKRLTPPSGPLPLTPPQAPSELSVSPSSASSDNPGAAFWKRTSGSSSVSSASARSSPIHPYPAQRASMASSFGGGSIGSKRRSMPPPRPAPSFAPPPAPEQQQSQKTRFRTSIAQRALRLSLTAPRPPPSGVLPPRPDEPEYAHHRRSSSSNSAEIPPRPDSAASSRSISIKQRLRILSAPSPSPVVGLGTLPQDTTADQSISVVPHVSSSSCSSISTTHSRPTTPPLPGTPITTMQNHPSFLQPTMSTLPTVPPRHPLRPPPQRLPSAPEITSLSPPPRRGSKQLVAQYLTDADSGNERDHENGNENGDSDLPDFSDIRAHGGSVVSLGFVALE